jgi:hypothetical protein
MQFPEKNDLAKLLYLYSDSNVGEVDVVAFWARSVHLFCTHRRSVVINTDEFVEVFIVNGIFPTSFGIVISQLEKDKVLLSATLLPRLGSNEINSLPTDQEPSSLIPTLVSSVFQLSDFIVNSMFSGLSINDSSTKNKTFYNFGLLSDIERVVLEAATTKDQSELAFTLNNVPGFPFSLTTFLSEAITSARNLDSEIRQVMLNVVCHETDIVLRFMSRNRTLSTKGDFALILVPSSASVSASKQASSFNVSLLRVRLSIHHIQNKVDNMQAKMAQHKQQAIKAKVSCLSFRY